MQIEFEKRGSYKKAFSNEDFASYVGQLPDFTQTYLDAAAQLVETAILKSFTDHRIRYETSETVKVLPYGPAKKLLKLEKVCSNGTTKELSTKWSRQVGEKVYLPECEGSWLLTYITKPVSIGPMDKLEVYRVAELLINGEYVCPKEIRQNMDQHRKSIIGTHQNA